MNISKQRGVSLIELMIALAIGTVLVLGLVQVFSASRAAYQMSEGMARVQENARFAMDFLQRDIRMAGHFGCVNDQAHFVRDEGDPVNNLAMLGGGVGQGDPHDFRVSIQAYEATGTAPGEAVTIASPEDGWLPDLPSVIESNLSPLPGSDVLVLRYLGSRGTPVTNLSGADLTIPPDGWNILTDEGVNQPTLFGIADCSGANIFSGSGGPGGVTVSDAAVAAELVGRYRPQPGSQTVLYRANSIVYYVAEGATGEPALHRARYNNGIYSTEELVEGVESMQLLFGMDDVEDVSPSSPPVGNITEHQTANQLGIDDAEWRRVGLVQVGMLVRSPSPAVATQAATDIANPRTLGVEFEPATANDARYRAVYESTIALRNRLFGN